MQFKTVAAILLGISSTGAIPSPVVAEGIVARREAAEAVAPPSDRHDASYHLNGNGGWTKDDTNNVPDCKTCQDEQTYAEASGGDLGYEEYLHRYDPPNKPGYLSYEEYLQLYDIPDNKNSYDSYEGYLHRCDQPDNKDGYKTYEDYLHRNDHPNNKISCQSYEEYLHRCEQPNTQDQTCDKGQTDKENQSQYGSYEEYLHRYDPPNTQTQTLDLGKNDKENQGQYWNNDGYERNFGDKKGDDGQTIQYGQCGQAWNYQTCIWQLQIPQLF